MVPVHSSASAHYILYPMCSPTSMDEWTDGRHTITRRSLRKHYSHRIMHPASRILLAHSTAIYCIPREEDNDGSDALQHSRSVHIKINSQDTRHQPGSESATKTSERNYCDGLERFDASSELFEYDGIVMRVLVSDVRRKLRNRSMWNHSDEMYHNRIMSLTEIQFSQYAQKKLPRNNIFRIITHTT